MARTASIEKSPPDAAVTENSGPRSLTRLLGMFDVLSQAREGLSLAELSIALESPKSSLLNLLRPLVAEGYLSHSGGMYRLGPSIFRLAAGVMTAWNFPKQIRPFMEDLSQRTEETIMLGVMVPEAEVITYVEILESPHPIRYQVPVGTSRPLYASSAGRLLLAYADRDWVRRYLATVVFKQNMAVTYTRPMLTREIATIRGEGVASSFDVYMKGLASVAAPVFDANGKCIASLNVAGPTDRFRAEFDFLKSVVKEVASKASGMVGSLSLF
ncbi:IclR family transcriptional regulator [Caballeronia sp. LZ001]|uniref:IclR family transcriptional regulator n=1 Tax=Caballeronia sp. LZ001 TaxID=3038553 RepID=UPI00286288DC|nr:IclR family transcriptional regulator [Caballeronia sp. LZ001]MDR5804874.1 IclR family transcriptional regulator [Caballeronia sp. LZ001]